MGGSPFLAGWEPFFLALPVIGILVLTMFGLEQRFATPRRTPGTRRFFCEVDGKGRAFLSDPDGRPWQKGAVRQIEARLNRTDRPGI
jgi:hypothetical protein